MSAHWRTLISVLTTSSAEKDGPYYGIFGIQWRGYVAYICGILINVVGFAGAVGTPVPIGATYVCTSLRLVSLMLMPSDLSTQLLHWIHRLWRSILPSMSLLSGQGSKSDG